MDYTLYTTVDITNTGQYRIEAGKEKESRQEQNFQTVLQTLGMRANVLFNLKPTTMNAPGNIFGFNTSLPIRVWEFKFQTENDHWYQSGDNPIAFLLEDFNGVPYISGLDESVEQNYSVFVTDGPAKNIVFKCNG